MSTSIVSPSYKKAMIRVFQALIIKAEAEKTLYAIQKLNRSRMMK